MPINKDKDNNLPKDSRVGYDINETKHRMWQVDAAIMDTTPADVIVSQM